jgi:uncharacterized protein (TIGR03083 family)
LRGSALAVWQVVHDERRRLADDLENLRPEQWATPSLCAAWDIHDVLAHLVDTAMTSRLSFVRDMVTAGLDFDGANERGIARAKKAEPQETLGTFRRAAGLTRTPPASLDTRLVEAIVHGEDVRRPLAREGTYPHWAVLRALAYQLRTPARFGGGRERADGLTMIDAVTKTAFGNGPAVEASAVDLLLAASGRPVAAARLSGPGAQRLLDNRPPAHDATQEGTS